MKHGRREERLIRLKELMNDLIRRKDCYKIAVEEFHTSVDVMEKLP